MDLIESIKSGLTWLANKTEDLAQLLAHSPYIKAIATTAVVFLIAAGALVSVLPKGNAYPRSIEIGVPIGYAAWAVEYADHAEARLSVPETTEPEEDLLVVEYMVGALQSLGKPVLFYMCAGEVVPGVVACNVFEVGGGE